MMNELLPLDLCHLNYYLLGNKSTVLFPFEKKKKNCQTISQTRLQRWLDPWLTTKQPHTHMPRNYDNPHVGTKQTLLAKPTHITSTFRRKCRLIHTHRHATPCHTHTHKTQCPGKKAVQLCVHLLNTHRFNSEEGEDSLYTMEKYPICRHSIIFYVSASVFFLLPNVSIKLKSQKQLRNK